VGDFSRDPDDKLRAQTAAKLDDRLAAFRAADDLCLAVTVAEVDEQHAAMVAEGIDPAAEAHGLADVDGAKLAAGMGA
jgi:hypothetical protein